MPRPWSRSRPWPYRAEIAGVGVMTRAGQEGELVARKTRRLDAVSPPTYDYGALPPYAERPYVLGPLTGGMGQARQQAGTPTRYRYAWNADLSIAGRRRRGPAVRLASVGASPVTGFVDALWGATPSAMAFVDDDLKVRTGPGTWTTLASIPGAFPTESLVAGRSFEPQSGGWPHRLYLTTSLGRYLGWSGGVPVVIPTAAGFFPRYLEVVGADLWVGDHAAVARLTPGQDPLLAASYAASIPVGSDLGFVTGLGALGGDLVVLRSDGVYTVNADGTYNELTPDLRPYGATAGTIDDAQAPILPGRNPGAWRGALWVGYGQTSWRLSPGDPVALDPVGLSRLAGNDGPVRGQQTAFAGDDWFGYFAYHDEAAGTSFVVKHGAWIPGDGEGFAFVEAVNGATMVFPGRRITALHVTRAAYARNPALLIGFASGEVGEVVLPDGTPDPLLDPLCTFTAETSEVYWPDHDADAPADLKHWRGFAATGAVLDATNSLTVSYRADPAAAWTPLAPSLTANQQRVDTPATPAQTVSAVLRVKETLGGGGATTPDVDAVVLFEQVRPALQLEARVTAVAAEGVTRLDGARDRRTGAQIRAALRATAGPGPTEAYLPDGARVEADFVDYAERLVPVERSYGDAWEVDLTFVEFRTLSAPP